MWSDIFLVDEWRTYLYPLGFLSALAFSARFIIQWLLSEKAGKSVAPKAFWQLSLIGNCLLILHTFIQVQYHLCLVQGFNAVISWRNLNLMQHRRPPVPFYAVLILFLSVAVFISGAFIFQDWMLSREGNWFRVPTAPWHTFPADPVSIVWHAVGTIGYLLFSSRFWIQWWFAEQAHTSLLPLAFWWLSLTGALLSIAYFLQMNDTVNLIGPLIGLVPYIRNLMLSQNPKPPLKSL